MLAKASAGLFEMLLSHIYSDERAHSLEHNHGWRNKQGGNYADMAIDGHMVGDADVV